MRVNTNRWPKTQTAENFRFFAEVMQEAVDEDSWESYRSDSLSFLERLRELLASIDQVERREIPKPVLGPMLAELSKALVSDPVAAAILAKSSLSADNFELRQDVATEALRRRVELLQSLTSAAYRQVCEVRIREFCFGDGKKKDEVVQIAKLYASDVISSGINRRYVFTTTKNKFFSTDILRCTKGLLDEYFKLLSPVYQKFLVFFCGFRGFL